MSICFVFVCLIWLFFILFWVILEVESRAFYFILGGRLQRKRADMKKWGDEWDWGVRYETHKGAIKN